MKRISKHGMLMFLGVVFLIGSGFTSAGEKAQVLIDGRDVTHADILKFERDDTVQLEATGIKPNSIINIHIKKAGINWVKHKFEVDETGEVIGIMHMPEKKMKVTCTVMYYDADDTYNEHKLKFQTY